MWKRKREKNKYIKTKPSPPFKSQLEKNVYQIIKKNYIMNRFVYLCATGLLCVASEVVLFVAVDLVSYARDHHHPKRKHHHYPSKHNFRL